MSRSQFYCQSAPFTPPTIYSQATKDSIFGSEVSITPISYESASRLLFWAYGIDIFIFPQWQENEDKSLLLKGYTYLAIKSQQYKYDSWHKIAMNSLIQFKDGKQSLAPLFPSQESTMCAAIEDIIHGSLHSYVSSNEGYLYTISEGRGWHFDKIPHYTPYAVTLDENFNVNALFEFSKEDGSYHNILDKEQKCRAVLKHEHFFADTVDKSLAGKILCPITRIELAEEIKNRFIPNNEI